MNDYDEEGLIIKLRRKISRLEQTLRSFANKDSWYVDYENYNTVWAKQSDPTKIAKNALEDDISDLE